MAKRVFSRKIYKKNERLPQKLAKKLFGFLKVLLFLFLIFILILTAGIFSLFIFYAKDLPRPEKFTERQFPESTKIFDRSGKILLWEMYEEEKRTLVPLETIPEHLKKIVILTEDANFYQHHGIDFQGIVRSILADLKIGKPIYGGSTITQQLVRSAFLSLEKTPRRKTREIILALELDRRYSKDQILEWYLNQIPFGPNIYGVEAASQTYFKKSVREISLGEAAILAALIRAPSYLSPYGPQKELLLARKNYLLERMEKAGLITKEEKEKAQNEEIKFAEILQPIKAPHFVMYVRDYLIKKYGEAFLKEKGLRVYTTLDWQLQEIAEKAVKEGVERNKKYRAYNAALVALDPRTGQILAMVGSADWSADPFPEGCQPGKNCLFEPKVNVATFGIGRQPGSAFKPFVYATAFKNGYDDKTIVNDEPSCWPEAGGRFWCPQNYDGLFRGPVTLRQALAQSLNVPSVKVLDSLAGYQSSIKTAQELGITTLTNPANYGLSIVLGGAEVKLLDMVSAYGVFATEGLKVSPVSILKIEDSQGNLIEENKKNPRRVLDPKVARLINDILSDNNARAPIFGFNSPMYFPNHKVSAKTGTTQNYQDGWIIGYTPSLVAGVWVGNNNNSPMLKEPGIVVAGPIWRDFFEKALALSY